MSDNKNITGLQKTASQSWHNKASFRLKNRKWLNYSGKIALRILSAIEDVPGMNQKRLAELAEVSPQQISKIVKGQENLTLQSIAKLSEILNVELIDFPQFKYNKDVSVTLNAFSSVTLIIIIDSSYIINTWNQSNAHCDIRTSFVSGTSKEKVFLTL